MLVVDDVIVWITFWRLVSSFSLCAPPPFLFPSNTLWGWQSCLFVIICFCPFLLLCGSSEQLYLDFLMFCAFLCLSISLSVCQEWPSLSLSDSQILPPSWLFQAKALCTSWSSYMIDCDRKLLKERERDKKKETAVVQVIGIAVSVIGHLRPSFYTHSVPPSPPDFLCVCVCVHVWVHVCCYTYC